MADAIIEMAKTSDGSAASAAMNTNAKYLIILNLKILNHGSLLNFYISVLHRFILKSKLVIVILVSGFNNI